MMINRDRLIHDDERSEKVGRVSKSPVEIKGNSVKIVSKSNDDILTVAGIKKAIRDGHTYCSDLARLFKCSRQRMSYRLKKLENDGIIEIDVLEGKGHIAKYYRVVETSVKQFKLTSNGDWFAPKKEQTYFRDGTQISYGIVNYDKWFKPDKDWKLGTTLMKGVTIDDVFIRIANDKTITFILPKIYGKDEVEPITKADYKAYQIRERFLKMYPDFELTPMPINIKLGNLGTTELAEVLEEYSGIKSDSFIIDKTPKKGALEFKITDPVEASENMRDTVDFFATGKMKQVMNELENIHKMTMGTQSAITAISNTMLLLTAMIKTWMEREK